MNYKKITIDDLAFLNEVRNECAGEFLHDSTTFTLEETKKWFKKYKPDYYIIVKNSNRIGYFRTSNYSEVNKNLYVGADLHSNYRGLGLGYIAYLEFMELLFEKYDLHKISLEVLANNKRAFYLYHKLGFHVDGVKREEVYKNDMYVDSIIMSILRKEFYEKL